jgi:hypothetical protein
MVVRRSQVPISAIDAEASEATGDDPVRFSQ